MWRTRQNRYAQAPVMLLYFAFIIVLNLGVGYALGAYLGPLPLDGLLRRTERDESDDTPLVQPVADASHAASAEAASFSADSLQGVSETQVLSGLEAFQKQLAELGQEMEDSKDDSQAFGKQATKLQEANHAYLQTAHEQIDQLDPAGEAHKTASAGVEQVDHASQEFDALLEGGVDDEANREKLLSKTNELTEKAGEAQTELKEHVEELKQQRDAATGLATLDGLIAQIEEVLNDGGAERQRTAALIRTDPIEGEHDPEIARLARAKLASVINESLAGKANASQLDDGQYLLLMEEAELKEISAAIDKLRQEIAATTFFRGEEQLHATVTCAVADLPGAKDRSEVLERLNAALDESRNHGTNHTFHHDGMFATVVKAASGEVEARTIEL